MPKDAVAMPLPKNDTTTPVMKTYLVMEAFPSAFAFAPLLPTLRATVWQHAQRRPTACAHANTSDPTPLYCRCPKPDAFACGTRQNPSKSPQNDFPFHACRHNSAHVSRRNLQRGNNRPGGAPKTGNVTAFAGRERPDPVWHRVPPRAEEMQPLPRNSKGRSRFRTGQGTRRR